MKLSLVIPAHNEEDCIEETLLNLHQVLMLESIEHELLVINDNSTDRTEDILLAIQQKTPEVRHINNCPPHGFGSAVRQGLENFTGGP